MIMVPLRLLIRSRHQQLNPAGSISTENPIPAYCVIYTDDNNIDL